jgi:hypothetical protein
VNNGIEKIDRAVELASDNINVRMIRAHNSLNLPRAFHRIKIAITDFEHLLTLRQEKQQEFSKDLLAKIFLAWKRLQEKRRYKQNKGELAEGS